MRNAMAAILAVTLAATLACSALDPPTAPTAMMLTAPKSVSTTARRDPLDISGSWVTTPLQSWDWLPGTVPDYTSNQNTVRCESYAYIENEEWNSLLLKRDGTRIVGTSRPGMGITCGLTLSNDRGIEWFVDIDDAFEGQVLGNEVRLALNRYIEVRVSPVPNTDTWVGTMRIRMDPRPYADPYWVEKPFGLWPTNGYPCWWVHLQPPYCIPAT